MSAQIKTLKLLWLLNIFCGRRNDDGQLSFGSMGKMLIWANLEFSLLSCELSASCWLWVVWETWEKSFWHSYIFKYRVKEASYLLATFSLPKSCQPLYSLNLQASSHIKYFLPKDKEINRGSRLASIDKVVLFCIWRIITH